MNRNRLFLFLILLPLSFLEARIVDGIALIVEGEAITSSEIRAVKSQMGISKSEAIDLLIQDRLQASAMKNVTIPEERIDTKISEIASQNNITIPQMQKMLKAQGTSWTKYRSSIRNALKKERFYQETVSPSIQEPTQDELKIFYNKHKKLFAIPKQISMIEYTANSKKAITQFLKTHKKSYVKSRKVTKSTKEMEASLLGMLLQTPNNQYTKALNTGNRYIVYLIKSKKGSATMPFEAAKSVIISKLKQEQRSSAFKEYFEKLRTRANIQIIR